MDEAMMGAMPPEAAMGGQPDAGMMIRMLADQVAGGLSAAHAQIAGTEDMILQALMMAAESVAPPAPGAGAFFEGAPADAQMGMMGAAQGAPPMPGGGAPPMQPGEAEMLAAMLGGAA